MSNAGKDRMEQKNALPDRIATRFGVVAEAHVADTAIARLWRVRDADGAQRAVKVWKDGARANEGPGVALMKAWDGRGTVAILDESPDAVLMEWLGGPSLAAEVQNGHDLVAAETLGAVARGLHSGPVRVAGLIALEDWCKALLGPEPVALRHDPDRRVVGQAQEMLRRLLSSAPEPVALHGDLHHGNVARGAGGWRAFDAKGLRGDLAFELANAFAHPAGYPVDKAGRVTAVATIWSEALGCDRQRLLRWAHVKAALSLVWALRKHRDDPPRRALLRTLAGFVHN